MARWRFGAAGFAYREEAAMTDEPDPDRLARLDTAVRALPAIEREVFLAVRLDGLTYAEIAHRTGLSPRAVERKFASALIRIVRQLHRDGGV